MDIIAFCEAQPDWIQFANAHVQLRRYPNAYLTFLTHAPLHFLGPKDTLLVVGHGSPHQIGNFTGWEIVQILIRQGLKKNTATIRFQTCSSADLTKAKLPVLYEIKKVLNVMRYTGITLQGSWAPSITGWSHTGERVVPHQHFQRAVTNQNTSMFQNSDQIQQAEAYIAKNLRNNLSSGELIKMARVVHTYAANFFIDFSDRFKPFTVSASVGFTSL